MGEILSITRRQKRYIVLLTLLFFAMWSGVGLLPMLALKTSLFSVQSAAEAERVRAVMAQFGTYGDMFGVLTSLFTGLALLGVVITILLQHRELLRVDEELRAAKQDREREHKDRLANHMLVSVAAAAQVYAAQFSTNPAYYIGIYDGMKLRQAADPDSGVNPADSVYGKLIYYHGFLDGFAKEAIGDLIGRPAGVSRGESETVT